MRPAAGRAAGAWALALLVLLRCGGIDARLIGAAVIPHGDFALDPGLIHGANGSTAVHNAATAVGQALAGLRPDLILVSSPHGIEASRDFALYGNSNSSGYALIGQDMHNASWPLYKVPLSIPLAKGVSDELTRALGPRGRGLNVSSMLGWADSEPFPLRWGEVVPLWFMRSYIANGTGAGGAPPQGLVLSQPARRYNDSVAMVPELLSLGAALRASLDALQQTVVVIISADLAHTHEASGPYGYSPTAEPFDQACGRWAGSLNATALTVDAAALADRALSCGYTGMVMLQGMLADEGRAPWRSSWRPRLWANEHPTYYGMLVASFMPPGPAASKAVHVPARARSRTA